MLDLHLHATLSSEVRRTSDSFINLLSLLTGSRIPAQDIFYTAGQSYITVVPPFFQSFPPSLSPFLISFRFKSLLHVPQLHPQILIRFSLAMDLFSVLRAAGDLVKQVNHYSAATEEAAKFFEAFKPHLDSTLNLLTSLETLIKENYDDTRTSTPSPSQETAGQKRKRSILRSIEDEIELSKLQTTLREISTWLQSLESGSGSNPNVRGHLLIQRGSSNIKAQMKMMMTFSSELEKFKSTATLFLTMVLRYDGLLVEGV